MVDVSRKAPTLRTAQAAGRVVLGESAFRALCDQSLSKGDVLATARLAGIMGAKQTSALIPLCHQIPLASVTVDFEWDEPARAIVVLAKAVSVGSTGVEMEVLTAVTVAALTIYDMCKAVSKAIRIDDVHLVSKTGGTSGAYHRRHI